MTGTQMESHVKSLIRNEITFDVPSKLSFLYLGRLKDSHFFTLVFKPLNITANYKQIKAVVKIIEGLGFVDTHWTSVDSEDVYRYYCYISEDKLNKFINIK